MHYFKREKTTMKKLIVNLFPLLILTSCSYLSTNKLNSSQQPNAKLIPIPVEKAAESDNKILIPTVAINQQDDTTGVLVGAPDRSPQFVPITLGAENGDRTEVIEGLNGTEHILVEADRLPPHMRKKQGELKNEEREIGNEG